MLFGIEVICGQIDLTLIILQFSKSLWTLIYSFFIIVIKNITALLRISEFELEFFDKKNYVQEFILDHIIPNILIGFQSYLKYCTATSNLSASAFKQRHETLL